jgi:hypothetical protein
MISLKTCFLSLLLLLPVNQAAAEACRLDHATYREARSGAAIQFRPKNKPTDAMLTTGVFQLHLPNISEVFEGDITWTAGRYARPNGEIGRTCVADESADDGGCWLWTGIVYRLGDSSAGLLEDEDMMAPEAILFVDFGRSLATTEIFARANPDRATYDVFTLTGCSS